MEYELEWVRPSLVVCRMSGVATVEGCEALMRAMRSDPQYQPGVDVIIVLTNLDISALTASDIERIAGLSAQSPHTPPARSAVVAGPDSPTRYGLARMFEAYIDSQANTTIRVFETFDEAITWLTLVAAPVPSQPPGEEAKASPQEDR